MSPSGNLEEGEIYVTALIKVLPLEVIEPSNLGGVEDRSLQIRTVASREAVRTESGLGNATPRT